MMRIGHGYDVHAFGEGDHVVLGGVRIPHRQGLVAHSDGDVVLHAICDALLGAAGLGDIGTHFPDTDDAFRDADSRVLLRAVMAQLDGRGWAVGNVDVTVVAPWKNYHPTSFRLNLSSIYKLGVSIFFYIIQVPYKS